MVGLLAGCKETSSSILLTIEAAAGLPTPDELRLSVFAVDGVAVSGRRLPDSGAPDLPGDVVLFPPTSEGELRILVRALVTSSVVGEGATSVELRAREQVRATLTLSPGFLADRDQDGVPDLIDSCPDQPNPDQGPCAADGGVDAGDAGTDGGPDTLPDLGLYDQARDTHGCLTDGDCEDNNSCTQDSCAGGICSNSPINEGQSCDDGDACTASESCQSGLCTGGTAVACPPPSNTCQTASCDPAQGCVTQTKADGDSCNDGKYCTVGDSCNAAVCQGTARDCSATAPLCNSGACNETQNNCVYSSLPNGTTCDDSDPCTQDESCASGSCTPPTLLIEVIDSTINPIYSGDRSLAIDSAGKLHTVYYSNESNDLWYASNKTGSWKTEVVDTASADVGIWPSVAADAQGAVYIAYGDTAAGQIRLAQRAAGATTWQETTVHSGASPGHNSLTIDGAAKLHLSFKAADKLYYATGTPGGMAVTQVDEDATSGGVGFHSSLALDQQGKVHIAHGRAASVDQLRYTTNVGGSWVSSAPASSVVTSNHGAFASIAVGPTGQLYITHTNTTAYGATQGTLYLTHDTGSGWTTEVVAGGAKPGDGTFSAILLDSQQNLHVAYRDPGVNKLRHGFRSTAGSWTFKDLDVMNGGTCGWTSIARETSGRIHVTYEKVGMQVKHASFSACP